MSQETKPESTSASAPEATHTLNVCLHHALPVPADELAGSVRVPNGAACAADEFTTRHTRRIAGLGSNGSSRYIHFSGSSRKRTSLTADGCRWFESEKETCMAFFFKRLCMQPVKG